MKMMPFYKLKHADTSDEPRGINRMDGIIYLVIVAAIAIAIMGQLGPAAVAPGITSSQDTTNISGYSTWTPQAQASYKSTGGNLALVWFVLPFVLLLAALKGL